MALHKEAIKRGISPIVAIISPGLFAQPYLQRRGRVRRASSPTIFWPS